MTNRRESREILKRCGRVICGNERMEKWTRENGEGKKEMWFMLWFFVNWLRPFYFTLVHCMRFNCFGVDILFRLIFQLPVESLAYYRMISRPSRRHQLDDRRIHSLAYEKNVLNSSFWIVVLDTSRRCPDIMMLDRRFR